MRIAIASDEAGHEAKEQLTARLIAAGHEVADAAPTVQGQERADYAEQVALSVLRHDAERGIIVSSRGVGASVAANRVPGVRAALCNDAYSAHVGAKTEGMNVLVLALHSLAGRRAQEVVDAYLGATLAPVEVVGGLPPRRLQRVFAHIRENIARDLSVAELAQVVGMSQYYFSKLFKMSTGTTPHQYVMRQRVERAQEQLRESRTRAGRGGHAGRLRDPKPLHQRLSPAGGSHSEALPRDASVLHGHAMAAMQRSQESRRTSQQWSATACLSPESSSRADFGR